MDLQIWSGWVICVFCSSIVVNLGLTPQLGVDPDASLGPCLVARYVPRLTGGCDSSLSKLPACFACDFFVMKLVVTCG